VSPAMRSDQTNDALVAYSATGQEPWPHALERRDIVDRIRLLASGDLIYSIRQPGGATVTRLAASGRRYGARRCARAANTRSSPASSR
jgi:hypothetical protein